MDAHGPFDLPINDYVEPDGQRGYGPQELAEAVQRALHRIAQVHYADGPVRVRRGFAQARVEAVVTDAVQEKLGQDPPVATQPRFKVTSGSPGRGSRVEFVCPGRRDDPRGHRGDNVMNRMCPTKYALEASAGLSVTGRWPGYVEGRGHEVVGLSRWMGWTRSDDEQGDLVVRREIRWLVWGLLAVLAVSVATRRWSSTAAGAGVHGAIVVLAAGVLVALGLGADTSGAGVSMLESPPAFARDFTPWAWLPVLLVVGGLPRFIRAGGRGDRLPRSVGPRAVAILVALAAVLVAAHPSALDWVNPDLFGAQDLSLERWVQGAAEAVGERAGLDIFEVEGAVAAGLLSLLVGAAAGLTRTAGLAGLAAWPGRGVSLRGKLAVGVLAVVLVAAALVVSRKTAGASALVPGAIGLTLVLQSGLACLRGAGTLRWPGRLTHVAWVGLAVWLVLSPWSEDGAIHPFVLLCTIVGLLAALSGAALAWLPRRA